MKNLFTILLTLGLVGQIYAQPTATLTIAGSIGPCQVTDIDLSINGSVTDPDDGIFRYTFFLLFNGNSYQLKWDATNDVWQLNVANTTIYTSSVASYPYPPALSFGNWADAGSAFGAFCPIPTRLDGTGTQTVLPVELTFFKTATENNQVNLIWQTASEENNEGFDIQRSTDGETWESIGFVAGAGTTLEVQDYEFMDTEAKTGKFYYRLKQMDFSEQFEYSEIITVELKSLNSDVAIYPNPVSNNLTIEGVQGIATIHNLLGQPVKEFSINNEQENIDISDLTEGQYLLMIQAENGERVIQQFVKQ